ncbi:Alg13 family protein [Megaselia abdita]
MSKYFQSIFVTVGTTSFDDLITTINEPEIVEALEILGCKKLVLQIGSGVLLSTKNLDNTSIKLETFTTKSNISNFIKVSDLVISHAGAGTCLEVLKAGKNLIVVINESLMNNHQAELAMKLSEIGCAIYCTTSGLKTALSLEKLNKLKPYESSQGIKSLVNTLDILMGNKI